MKKIFFAALTLLLLLFAAAVPVPADASAADTVNAIRSVTVIDYLSVEVVMKKPLPKEELDPAEFDGSNPAFTFNEDIRMTGAPIPQEDKRTYRIPVNGLMEDVIYKISYKGSVPLTFEASSQEKMDKQYKGRYGDYF